MQAKTFMVFYSCQENNWLIITSMLQIVSSLSYTNEVGACSHNYDAEYTFHQSWHKITSKSRIIVAMH